MSDELANLDGELHTGLHQVREWRRQNKEARATIDAMEQDVSERKDELNARAESITKLENELASTQAKIDQLLAQRKQLAQIDAICLECDQ